MMAAGASVNTAFASATEPALIAAIAESTAASIAGSVSAAQARGVAGRASNPKRARIDKIRMMDVISFLPCFCPAGLSYDFAGVKGYRPGRSALVRSRGKIPLPTCPRGSDQRRTSAISSQPNPSSTIFPIAPPVSSIACALRKLAASMRPRFFVIVVRSVPESTRSATASRISC
jgi:hypothetical protein